MTTTGPARMAPAHDPVAPGATTGIELVVDGQPVGGLAGQTIAGVLLGSGRLTWRASRSGRPRGVFCGIGVCHDCLITVNGVADVRACQRRAADGDVITTDLGTPELGTPELGTPELGTTGLGATTDES